MSEEHSIPTNEDERKKLKAMIVEMTKVLYEIDTEREHLKEIADAASKTFDIPKKIVNKLARTMYKNNYSDLCSENEHFEFLYESLVGTLEK